MFGVGRRKFEVPSLRATRSKKIKGVNIAIVMKEQEAKYDISEPMIDLPKGGWKKWLNYQSVVKQVPFILFLHFSIAGNMFAGKTNRSVCQ